MSYVHVRGRDVDGDGAGRPLLLHSPSGVSSSVAATEPTRGPARWTSRQSPRMDPMAAGFVNLAGRTTR